MIAQVNNDAARRKRITDNELLKIVHVVRAKRDALPAHDAHHGAAKLLVAELVRDHGARLTKPLGGFRLAMAGVAATSTSGESGLLTNWINAAYRELDKRRSA